MADLRDAPRPGASGMPAPAARQAHPVRLGVLGGSFNPPHLGHLALARHARAELGLERVLLMPARHSPGKPAEEEPNPAHPEHRLAMCRLVVAGVDGVEVCALEIERDGPSYTVDTLRALHAAHPDIEITFILGADVARTLPSWQKSQELPALAQFAVALRPGMVPEEVRREVASLAAGPGQRPSGLPMSFLSMPAIDVSSSLVREHVRLGLPVELLVGPAVASYIATHGLYRTAVAQAPAP
ncbi:MAG TPA: nicotinate (nicotinamide) nucleotide adenylyltransferase [Solirubrobacteraceae bacterium]|jgi:nicotinate-nucleotide adenylyltransferase|nr:nicotinate (nicotinamide) nucleotide adenylyltransferase [Solirubrobacteraceae bacterium]